MLARFIGLILVSLIFVTPCYANTPAKVFDAKTFTLQNGLEVIVVENTRAPVVTHMLWVKAGAADEYVGRSGAAHFLEHLMFKGTPTVGAGEYSRTLRKIGAEENAFTSQDYTAYFATVSKDNLELVMQLESDRFQNLLIPEKEVQSERKVILEERTQRTDNDPAAKLNEQIQTALFVNHPYGEPVIGWRNEMETLSRDDTYGFYQSWYAPNNMILVISGAVTVDEVKVLSEKYYGGIAARNVPKRHRTAVPPLPANAALTLEDARVQQPIFQRTYLAPSARENIKDSYALEVLEEILGGGATGQLYKKLAIENKVAGTIGFSYSALAYNDATLSISATPAKNIALTQLEKEINTELGRFLEKGPTAQDVQDAQKRLITQAVFARDSISGPAFSIGFARVLGVPLDAIESWPNHIAKVTTKEVHAVAQKYLSGRYVSGYLLPTPPAPKEKTK